MDVDLLYDRTPAWFVETGPEAAVAVLSQCSLARNVADLPFPGRCSEEEKGAAEERIQGVLDHLDASMHGQYFSLAALDPYETRFLAERQLVTYGMMLARGARGVYVSEDQAMCIMVNGDDHLCARVLRSGLQLREAWAQTNAMDDVLSRVLDYAFDARLGYLTANLGAVGTGLKASVLLHLPGLAFANRIAEHVEHAAAQGLTLRGLRAGGLGGIAISGRQPELDIVVPGVGTDQSLYTDLDGALCGALSEAAGSLYLLSNQETLGVSEEEIVFHVAHVATETVDEEKAARQAFLKDSHRGLEDQICRAHGLASSARLMEFQEGLELLSSLRLGIDTGVLRGNTIEEVNRLLLASQGAHLGFTRGGACDALALNRERADIFRKTVTNN